MRRVLFITGSVVFVDTVFFAALTPLVPHYADRFGLSKAGAGLLAAAYPVGVLAGSIPSGLLAARIGVRPASTLGLLLVAASSTTFGFAGSAGLLDATRFVQGIGSACAWTAALTWIVEVAPPSRRGDLIGRTMGVAIGGAMLGPVLGGAASLVGTGEAFTGVAAVAVAVAALALRTDAPRLRTGQPVERMAAALRDPRIVGGLWLVALPALLFGTTSLLVPLHLARLGAGAVALSGVFLAAVSLEACVSPLVGRIADRRGRLLPLSIGLAASAAGAAVLPWPSAPALLGLLAVLASAAFGVFWVPAMAMLADSADRIDLHPAWAFALMNLAWAPGQALGSAAGGGIAHATADAVPFLALSGACLLTLAALRRAASGPRSVSPGGPGTDRPLV